jgi:hypothetical protein
MADGEFLKEHRQIIDSVLLLCVCLTAYDRHNAAIMCQLPTAPVDAFLQYDADWVG